jgi:hypothetical protein
MRRTAVFKWWKRFRDGETNVEVEPHSGGVCSTIFTKLATNGLQHVFESGWSVVRSASLAKGRYLEKKTVTAPLQSSDSE